MFAPLIFYFLVMNNSLHNFLGRYFNNFTLLQMTKGDIIRLFNLRFKNPFVIEARGKNYGTVKFKAN